MSDKIAILLNQVHEGAALMAAGVGKMKSALVEIERSEAWRGDYATFADYVESKFGIPPASLATFLSRPLPFDDVPTETNH